MTEPFRIDDFACSCGDEKDAERAADREWVLEWLSRPVGDKPLRDWREWHEQHLLTSIIVTMASKWNAFIEQIPWDPGGWGAIKAETGNSEYVLEQVSSYVQCDFVEDGFVLTFRRWAEHFGDRSNWKPEDEDSDGE